jgi:hypothetical protein
MDAYVNGGDGVDRYLIPPFPGYSQCEYNQRVIGYANTESLGGYYVLVNNSNTLVGRILKLAGVKEFYIEGLPFGLNW